MIVFIILLKKQKKRTLYVSIKKIYKPERAVFSKIVVTEASFSGTKMWMGLKDLETDSFPDMTLEHLLSNESCPIIGWDYMILRNTENYM